MVDILVIGGGNAASCAALSAREQGASVLLPEAASREWRGENSQHICNLCCMHDAPQDMLVENCPEEEFWQDLRRIMEGDTNEALARLMIHTSSRCRDWMRQRGVNFQPPLSGALHVAWTNAFFMRGGKVLVNAYYCSVEKLGVQIRYNTPVQALELHNGEFIAALVGKERITTKSCAFAAGGFELNREWLREAWGGNARDEWPADNFLIRGTCFNQGVLLKSMMDVGADIIGDPSQSHCAAIDARASLYDGGICICVDCVSLGTVVNRGAERFHDEGEDFWPKCYAIWGRLVTQQPGQIGYSIIDSKATEHLMPPVFPGTQANTLAELVLQLGLDAERFTHTATKYNSTYQSGQFDHTVLDNYATKDLLPAKTRRARPLDQPPYYGYALRPGITLTYLGLKANERAAVYFARLPSRNPFVVGEMTAGNVLGKGHITGVGMSIGTTFGRIAEKEATLAAHKETHHEAA